jgi:ankyrin repeat protein
LHKAAGLGRKEIVELLIAEDADLNAKTYSGQTPLDRAVLWAEDKPEIAVFLRKHGGQTGEELNKEGK